MRAAAVLTLLCLSGCGSLRLDPGVTREDTSREFEPPHAWEAGFEFHFMDSTWVHPLGNAALYGARIEFHDGRRHRVVTGNDLFLAKSGAVRTPWQRLWLPDTEERETVVRITIGDREGNRTTAEYPVRVRRDGFYWIRFAVGTNVTGGPWISEGHATVREFDIPPGARTRPSDSLWVSYVSRPRSCFDCPF